MSEQRRVEQEFEDLMWRVRDWIKERFSAMSQKVDRLEEERESLKEKVDDLNHTLAEYEAAERFRRDIGGNI